MFSNHNRTEAEFLEDWSRRSFSDSPRTSTPSPRSPSNPLPAGSESATPIRESPWTSVGTSRIPALFRSARRLRRERQI